MTLIFVPLSRVVMTELFVPAPLLMRTSLPDTVPVPKLPLTLLTVLR